MNFRYKCYYEHEHCLEEGSCTTGTPLIRIQGG
ncbi:hypothetical protein T06_14960 [Trichinella sp. T6]|nr:hypothetical protein T06_14960 [Trichinella sp. T6]